MTQKEVLTRDFAKLRKNLIGKIKYNLFLEFESKAERYEGKCGIEFELKKIPEDGILLESVSKLKKILVNENKSKFISDGFTIKLKDNLIIGLNKVEISYESLYDHTGSGLHRFIDPEDNLEYIYSDFEPYQAHRMFPCFDQPDLKASFLLEVKAPKNWEIISNELAEKEETLNDKKLIRFKETKKISTYLFHVGAGNYMFFENPNSKIPMKIYCRRSIKKYIEHDYMLKVTEECLKFYEKLFDYSYPFSKYDQVFVPEFNSGAMENPGAITFSEHLVLRRELTRTERARLVNTLTHEMAHMWFGDLVTMEWWDGLWLNESFADFICYFVMRKATEFEESWEEFYARKSWAYIQDQLSTTHPIETNAENTDIAFSNFDGISYAKGAAVLKQLMFYIGEDKFIEGVRKYFKKHEWKNTKLEDFLKCLEDSSKTNLKEWFNSWIKTTGVNEIKPLIKTKDGKITSFKILQKPSKKNNILRNHKTKIALFREKENSLEKFLIKEISYKGEETELKSLEGEEKPAFVLLNYEDYDYVKEFFEEEHLSYLLENTDKVMDEFAKQMIYGNMWQMVRDAELDPKKFLDLILKNSPEEQNLLSLERMLLRAKLTMELYLNEKNFKTYSEKFFDLALERLNSDSNREIKNAWFNILVSSSIKVKKEKTKILLEILNSKLKFKNLKTNQDMRWKIIIKLSALDFENIDNFIKIEIEKDKGDIGEKKAAIAEASSPKNKEKFWKLYVSGKGKSLDYIREAMQGFYWKNQKDKMEKYIDLFFKNVKEVFEKQDNHYSKAFFMHLFPMMFPTKEVIEKTKNLINEIGNSNKLLKKYLMEGIDNIERTRKVMKKYN